MKWNMVFVLGIILLGLGCVVQESELSPGDLQNLPSASEVTVNLQNTQFNPSTISLAAGGKIHFINQDGFTHDIHITRNGEDVLPLTEIGPGDQLVVPITVSGTYELLCDRHLPRMRGTIIVK